MTHSFHTLGLRPELSVALERLSYTEMTPIQAQALPKMLAGQDVTGQAQTGSGKTAAFGLALLQRVELSHHAVQALVLCPTRELADQVANEIRRLAQRLPNTRIVSACGGRPFREQRMAIQRGCHVLVGTPGRIGKHLRTESLDLSQLHTLVLDEADRMLDMGFIDQVDEIVSRCPPNRQTLLFSATFPDAITQLCGRIQRMPNRVTVETQVATHLLKQQVVFSERSERDALIAALLVDLQPSNVLIFCETREDCRGLGQFLHDRGAFVLTLHGEMEQRDRDDVLLQFTNGSISVLVATNLAARGLDIQDLPLVLITELSPDPESHLHRIGRTGRAGAEGLAVSIVTGRREQERLQRIEEHIGTQIPVRPRPSTMDGDLSFLKPRYQTILVLSGKKDKIRKGDVLGSLVKEGGIPASAIGRMDLTTRFCAVAVETQFVHQAANHLRQARIKNKKVRVQMLD